MKKCNQKLKELIEEIVLPDIEDHMDGIFETIAKEKKANEELSKEIDELHEMRDEFHQILEEINNNELENDECVEIFEQIKGMIKDEE